MQPAVHINMGEVFSTHGEVIEKKSDGRRPLSRTGPICEDNIKVELKGTV